MRKQFQFGENWYSCALQGKYFTCQSVTVFRYQVCSSEFYFFEKIDLQKLHKIILRFLHNN